MLAVMFAQLQLSEHFWNGLVATSVFGLLALFLMMLAYKVFDWITPRLDVQEQLNKGNIAVAIVVAGFMVAIGFVLSHVVA